MGKDKKVEHIKLVTVDFKISMHCNACERTIAKAISKFKGVEKFVTDMNKHMAMVTGRFDPNKMLKKLKKKSKKVEIVSIKEEEKPKDESHECDKLILMQPIIVENDCCIKTETLMMFSDENPNACALM
ncbi:PREDICTED: heavy metal-associated isoprenylated plant protein 19-like [Lupinus angustifolius]|nr:PREDICTED: heavy metal-associated isoprenylated plant protein 19-like [Lupinus angustifolius]